MRSERVRRAAARAAVTASHKTGRPVHPDVAALAACECDDGRQNFCETCGEERLGVNFCPECGDCYQLRAQGSGQ